MKKRYFDNVKELIEYALDDIERFGNFEFKYDTTDNELCKFVRIYESIKEVDENTFEFNGNIFNLDLVVPCC